MKKIVALVLSLVMALSLATVAFAAVEVKDGTKLYSALGEGAVEYTYMAPEYKAGDENNKLPYLQSGNSTFSIDNEKGDTLYVENAAGKLEVASVKLGDPLTAFETYKYQAKAVDANKWSCTTDKHSKGYSYVDEDGDTQYAVDASETDRKTFNVLVDGKIKLVKDDDVIPGQHVLVIAKGATNGKEVGANLWEAECVVCGKTIQYSNKQIVGGSLYENTLDLKDLHELGAISAIPANKQVLNANGPIYIIEAASSTSNKDGVESAKTFDAGIAMYVGMSLLSVAGGAVVIGKKKEF